MNGSGPATLLRNGRIHRRADRSETIDSLLIWDGLVLPAEVNPSDIDVVDLAGRTVLPGLIDAHIHFEQYSLMLDQIDCETESLEECLDRVGARAEALPSGSWLRGHGWNQTRWDGFPTAVELDSVCRGLPAYLTAKSMHAAWANSRALSMAGIDSHTPDPPDGAIQLDEEGQPTGILFEGAMNLISDLISEPSPADLVEPMLEAQEQLTRHGITGLHDFDGPRCLEALQILRERGQLQLRVLKNIPVAQLEAARAAGIRTGLGDEWIRIGHVKVFADGALGPRTAAMLQPYDGEPDNLGILLHDQESLAEIFVQAAEAGLAMTVHAIGDRTNHEVLNAYEALRAHEARHSLEHRSHRVEHLQVMHPDDIDRVAALDLVASMQPIHATSDMLMADRYWGERSQHSYAWRAQAESGAHLAFGSDAPVEDPNPWWGIHAAVTRQRRDGSPGPDGWIPEQRLSLAQALRAYTIGPDSIVPSKRLGGALNPGQVADLLVLDQNPFDVDVDQLAEFWPVGVMVGGDWIRREF